MKQKRFKNVLLFKTLKKSEFIIRKLSLIYILSNIVCFFNLLCMIDINIVVYICKNE